VRQLFGHIMKPAVLSFLRIPRTVSNGRFAGAFSLLEMMTVLALLLIFASFALPTYQNIVLRAREAALRERRAGTNFYLDRADDLIDGYALWR